MNYKHLAGCLLMACGPMLEEEQAQDTESNRQEIQGGAIVSTGSLSRRATVVVSTPQVLAGSGSVGCTGTIISPNHILTASHCLLRANFTTVTFFSTGTTALATRTADKVFLPNWVNPFTETVYSPDGQLRDVAVLHLSAPIPSGFVVAELASPNVDAHTHDGQSVVAVGAGNHNNVTPAGTQLQFRWLEVLSVSDNAAESDGELWVSEEVSNGADSGGPLFASTATGVKVVGALVGRRYRPASSAVRSIYTAVRDHSEWISAAMADNVAPTRMLARIPEACNTTVRFSNPGTDQLLSRNDSTAYFVTPYTRDVSWNCDGTWEVSQCPAGTNILRVLRDPAGTRDFLIECRQLNPAT